MGLTTFFIYPWDIENEVNQEEEVWHILLEDVQKAWKHEFEAGHKSIVMNQDY